MKKILSATCAMMLASAGMMANAQQLPNVGFDTWQTCVEQKGTGGQTYSMNNSYVTRPGSEPFSWNGSSVNQMGIVSEELIKNQEGSALLFNKKVGFATLSSVAPGYITLGTPWVYATIPVKNSDGGTFGGVSFTYKPDAIKGRYKRTDNTGEASHIIAYLWNGEFNSKIANNEDCVDSDRAIFANNDPNGKLVASCDFTFTGTNNNEWQEIEVPLFYEKDAGDPTMMNVIISAGDYWNRGNLVPGTTLLVDDVDFVYYSTLNSLTAGEENVDLTVATFNDEGVATLTMNSNTFPTAESVSYTAKSQFATVDVEVLKGLDLVKVTVSNQGGKDVDGLTQHVYNLQYEAGTSGVESVAGDGVKVYAATGCVVVEGAEGVAQVYTADGKQVAVVAVNGKAEIALAKGLYIVRVGNKVQKVVVK